MIVDLPDIPVEGRISLVHLLTAHAFRGGLLDPLPSPEVAKHGRLAVRSWDNYSLFRRGVIAGREAYDYCDVGPRDANRREAAIDSHLNARQYSGHMPKVAHVCDDALARYEEGVIAGIDDRAREDSVGGPGGYGDGVPQSLSR